MSLCPLAFLENRSDWSSGLGASVGGVIGQVAGTQTLRGRFEEGGLLGRVLRLRASTGCGRGQRSSWAGMQLRQRSQCPWELWSWDNPQIAPEGGERGLLYPLIFLSLGGSTNPWTPPGRDPGVSGGPGHIFGSWGNACCSPKAGTWAALGWMLPSASRGRHPVRLSLLRR